MWEKLRIIFSIPELRQKILLTLGLLAVYRVGFFIVLPLVDQAALDEFMNQGSGGIGDLLNAVAVFSASQLNNATIFGLGIMPYISASIIFQILGTVYPPLEQLQKEGEAGRKKINEYTRYATVVLCAFQSWWYVAYLARSGLIKPEFLSDGNLTFFWHSFAVLTMITGTLFLMWLGEQIDEFGIGNGISLLIMAGILSQMPGAFYDLMNNTSIELGGGAGKAFGVETLIVLAFLFVAVVMGVIFITEGQRRITIQSAKHVRGRRVMGGTRDYLPLRVNQANVMPIIFASSLLLFPQFLITALPLPESESGWYAGLYNFLSNQFQAGSGGYLYTVLYVVMIYLFCYFWTAIIFNPKDVSENLQNWGSFIPGYRPGRRTAEYLEKVMARITYVGAAFLSVIAVLPTLVSNSIGVSFLVASFFGGTGLLIAVSVTFDLVRKIDSHLVMRNYQGVLDRS